MSKSAFSVVPLLLLFALLPFPQTRAVPADEAQDLRQPASQNWPTVGGDWGDSRYSALSQINAQNIKSLGAAWISQKFADGATSRVTPVVADGLMFVTAGAWVYALNPASGAIEWRYQAHMGKPLAAYTLQAVHDLGVPNMQGVAVGEGLVFVGLMDGHMIALEEKTGKFVWAADLRGIPPRKVQQASAAPIYAKGMVFCSVATVERFIGKVMALDAKTGKELWHFDVIPGPGQPGHETWPANSDIWKMGGGNVWLPPAVDADLGLVYYGTGNGNPLHVGEVRRGNNLHTACVVALDINTGKLRWYYQVMHHDVWESDIATPVVLYNTQSNGRVRKGIAAMRPDGYLFLLDRETGKPLIPIEERPVTQDAATHTSPTQPFPAGGQSILEDCASWKEKIPAGFVLDCSLAPFTVVPRNVLSPGLNVRLEPMSYDPQTGYIYAQGRDGLEWRRRPEDPQFWNQQGLGRRVPGVNEQSMFLAAVDTRNDRVVWRKQLAPIGGFGSGGALTTAGGLFFHRGGADGNLDAFDAKSGDLLWQFQTGYGAGDASPVSYEVDGRQYVAVVEGTEIWSFALGGTMAPRDPPKMAPPNTEAFAGPIQDTTTIETSALDQDSSYNSGTRYYVDDYAFSPYRARVQAGAAVTFINNGHQQHTIAAQDGSWTTGPLQPRETATLTFDKPGTYTYICKDHPFSYGQLIVVAASPDSSENAAASAGPRATQGLSSNFAAQAAIGNGAYTQSCAGCHGSQLGGNGEAAPALAGSDFLAKWVGRSAQNLFDRIRTTMPPNGAAPLNDRAYLAVVAYILQFNGIGAGNATLGVESLSNISIGGR